MGNKDIKVHIVFQNGIFVILIHIAIMMVCLFPQTFGQAICSQSLFSKHNMFRPSGPDHMLIRTVMFCLFSLSFLQESESQCKTKRQNTTNHKMKVYKIVNLLPNFLKKGPPLRGKFPLLLHPELHLAENPPLLPFPNARPPNSRGCRQAAPCSRRWCW